MPRTVTGLGTIYTVASATVYRNEDNIGAIVTSYGTEWYEGTFQPSKLITTLPVVTSAENGTGETVTREIFYDERGMTVRSVDERGTTTTYEYDQASGGMTRMTRDEGSGGFNLVTDYELDL